MYTFIIIGMLVLNLNKSGQKDTYCMVINQTVLPRSAIRALMQGSLITGFEKKTRVKFVKIGYYWNGWVVPMPH